jgi:hypothetical protein
MSAKNTAKNTAENTAENEIGKVPVAPTVEPFDFNDTLSAAEKDVEAAFTSLVLYIASQSTMKPGARDYIITRLAEVLSGEGKAPRAADYPSASALHKRLKRLFGAKGVLTIANMARVAIGYAPILG